MRRKTRVRAVTLAILIVSLGVVGVAFASAATHRTVDDHLRAGVEDGEAVVPPRDHITVVATDSNTWRGLGLDGPRSSAQLVAFGSNGSLLYHDDTHTRYWDVDPVPGTRATVEYVYADHLEGVACAATNASRHAVDPVTWRRHERSIRTDTCTLNGVEQVNLTTGTVTDQWARLTPGKDGTRYHDADRINETHWVVADVFLDGIFVINGTADRIEWRWNATAAYPTESGGAYPRDWTHINDVEVLDGRFMVSVRNQDQVVFVDPGTGLVEDWTLGADDRRGVLYEQHNPDYLPAEHGGPAVLVADSGNSRLVAYRREGGAWSRTWTWSDPRMQWPRDADRLPNGHTLVTDSLGDRVLELDADGDVVWSVDIAYPYEAERLSTGPESHGGHASPATPPQRPAARTGFVPDLGGVIDAKYVNAALYATPGWVGPVELAAAALAALTLLLQLGVEAAWRTSIRP